MSRTASRILVVSVAALVGCGGTDLQPEMPDPSVVDQSADEMGMPEPEGPDPSEQTAGAASSEPVVVIAGSRSEIEGSSPRLTIAAPRMGQRVRSGNVMLRLNLRNWELQPNPGRHVHFIVDNEPYIAVRDVSAPIDLNALVQENLGHELAEGTHVVRAFPSRGHHESVKEDGAFAMVMFHFRNPTEGFEFDRAAPLLTYSRPKGCGTAGERLLLDFYVANAELADDGHRVRYSIDGSTTGEIAQWVPHWIDNLSVGEHSISLTLLGADGEPVAGPFNETTRTIRIANSCD